MSEPITLAERAALRLARYGAWYVFSDVAGAPVSPGLETQEQAGAVLDATLALADSDPARYRRIIQGLEPAPTPAS